MSAAAFGAVALYDYLNALAPDWLEWGINAALLAAMTLAFGGLSGGKPRSVHDLGTFAITALALSLAFFGIPLMRLIASVIP